MLLTIVFRLDDSEDNKEIAEAIDKGIRETISLEGAFLGLPAGTVEDLYVGTFLASNVEK